MKPFDATDVVLAIVAAAMVFILGTAFRELSIRNDCDEQNEFRIADAVYDCVLREAE